MIINWLNKLRGDDYFKIDLNIEYFLYFELLAV